jgi:Fe-S-cluster containining protein
VPDEWVSSISPSRVAMLGTDCKSPRCTALQGEVGQGTRCSIYEKRSSTCREFEASWTDGVHNPDCDAARAAFGLLPVEPMDSGKVTSLIVACA